MTIDREKYIQEEMITSIGKRGLDKQAKFGAGVWLLSRTTEAKFVQISEFNNVFEDPRKIERIKEFIKSADLSRQVVAIWVVADVATVSNLRIVDIVQ